MNVGSLSNLGGFLFPIQLTMFKKTDKVIENSTAEYPNLEIKVQASVEIDGYELTAIETVLEVLNRVYKFTKISKSDKILLAEKIKIAKQIIASLRKNYISGANDEIVSRRHQNNT